MREIPTAQAFIILRLIRLYRRAETPPEKRKFIKSDPFSAKLCCDVDRWLESALQMLDDQGGRVDEPF